MRPGRWAGLNWRYDWRGNGLAAIGLLLLCAALRATSLPASFWEWDEINFARALHKFDIVGHSPQPPGFPVFVMVSRLAWFFLRDDQAALLAVNLVAGCFLGVVLYLIFCEVLPDRMLALGAAIAGCCTPAVLLPSVMARSDLAAMVAGLWIILMLLRGRSSRRWLLSGGAALGLGMGLRVTIAPLAIGVLTVVLLDRLRRREWSLVIGAAALALLGYLSWYLPTAIHTGWAEYRRLTAGHWSYLMVHDSLWSSYWTWEERWQGAFIRIWGEQRAALTVCSLGVFGLLVLLWQRHWRSVGWLLTIFLPFLLFTFIFNSPMGIIFYSMPYVPLFTTFATCGVMLLFRPLDRLAGRRVTSGLGLMAVMALSGWMVDWCGPAIRMLRRESSPPVRAIAALRRQFDPLRDSIHLDNLLLPYSYYVFANQRTSEWIADESLALNLVEPSSREQRHIFLLGPEPLAGLPHQKFTWSSARGIERLRPVSLGRYFELYLTDLAASRDRRFISGWYQQESNRRESWRWMGKTGTIALFNGAEEMNLRIIGRIPDLIAHPQLIIRLDGREVGRVEGREINWSGTVGAAGEDRCRSNWSMLTIESGETFVPGTAGRGDDERELGFQALDIRWEPTRESRHCQFAESRFLGEGWHDFRVGKPRSWRPADRRAVVALPAIAADGQLRLALRAPGMADGAPQRIELTIGGRHLASFSAPAEETIFKTWRIPATTHLQQPVELVILADRQTTFPGEKRPIAFMVTSLTWEPAESNPEPR